MVRIRTVGVVGENVKRRIDVGDRSQQVLVAIFVQFLATDRGDGTGKALLRLVEHTRYHDTL